MKFSVEYYYLMKFMAEHDSSSKTEFISFSLNSLSINNSFSNKLPEYCQKSGLDSQIFEKKINEYTHKMPDSYNAQRFISHKKKEIKAYENMRTAIKIRSFKIQRSSLFSEITKHYLTPWFIDFIFERKLDKHYLNVHKLNSWTPVIAHFLTNNQIEKSEILWKHCFYKKVVTDYELADSLVLSQLKFQPDFIVQLKKVKDTEYLNFLNTTFNLLSLEFIKESNKKQPQTYPHKIAYSLSRKSNNNTDSYEEKMYDKIKEIRIFFEKISLQKDIIRDNMPSSVKRPSRI